MSIHVICLFFQLSYLAIEVFFYYCIVGVPCLFLDINSLSERWLANISSHFSIDFLPFLPLTVFSLCWLFPLLYRRLCLMQAHFSIFSFVACAFDVTSEKSLPRPVLRILFLSLFSSNFKFSGLIFRSLVHFVLIFVR